MEISLERMDQLLALNSIHVSIGQLQEAILECGDALPKPLQEDLSNLREEMENLDSKIREKFYEGREYVCKDEDDDDEEWEDDDCL